MWRELGLRDALAGHDAYVTTAGNIGKPGCSIPTCGLEWITTRQPIVLDDWPAVAWRGEPDGPITTVASWRGALPAGGLSGHDVRPPRPRIPAVCRAAASDARTLRGCSRHPSGRRERRPAAVGVRMVAGGSAPGRRRSLALSRLHPPIDRGIDDLEGDARADAQRPLRATAAAAIWRAAGLSWRRTPGSPICCRGDAGLLTFTTVEEAAEAAQAIERDYARHSARGPAAGRGLLRLVGSTDIADTPTAAALNRTTSCRAGDTRN